MLETKFTALEKDNKEIKTNVDREIYKKTKANDGDRHTEKLTIKIQFNEPKISFFMINLIWS